jgi:hypothetical protein
MQNPTIRYYPTGNGDMTLIVLTDGTTILIDCKIRNPDADSDNGKIYDVKTDLLERLWKEDGVPHLDAFILTHPDKDHCQGFETHFYQGKPDDYSESDKDEERIIIDELWFAPRIFAPHETDLCPDAEAFKKEADRRKELHQKKKDSRDEPGNQLRCVGFSANGSLEGLDDILSIPGTLTSRIAGSDRTDLQLFILAPVKKDSDDPEGDRNDTSIAFAAEFLDGENVTNRVLFFGDAGCGILERIYDQNKDTENEHLVYDLLQTPHHCSWYTFSDCSYDEDNTASEKVIELLERKREGAQIVASSKPVKDDDDDPPSYQAKQEYVGVVGSGNFLCTGEHPSEGEPKPLIFSLTENGPRRDDPPKGNQGNATKGLPATGAKPRTYG